MSRPIDGPESDAARLAALAAVTIDPERLTSEVVVEAVARADGCEPTALSPLYDAIDPGAVDALLERARETSNPAAYRLRFPYEGYDVFVRGDGLVLVE